MFWHLGCRAGWWPWGLEEPVSRVKPGQWWLLPSSTHLLSSDAQAGGGVPSTAGPETPLLFGLPPCPLAPRDTALPWGSQALEGRGTEAPGFHAVKPHLLVTAGLFDCQPWAAAIASAEQQPDLSQLRPKGAKRGLRGRTGAPISLSIRPFLPACSAPLWWCLWSPAMGLFFPQTLDDHAQWTQQEGPRSAW